MNEIAFAIFKSVIVTVVSDVVKSTRVYNNATSAVITKQNNYFSGDSSNVVMKIGECSFPVYVNWGGMNITKANETIETFIKTIDVEVKCPYIRKWAKERLIELMDKDKKNENLVKSEKEKNDFEVISNIYKQILASIDTIDANVKLLKNKINNNKQKWLPNMRSTTYDPFYANILTEFHLCFTRIQFDKIIN